MVSIKYPSHPRIDQRLRDLCCQKFLEPLPEVQIGDGTAQRGIPPWEAIGNHRFTVTNRKMRDWDWDLKNSLIYDDILVA